jgi:hypothetical protein
MFEKSDLSKEHLYKGVKSLLESENQFIHLPQQKLYTLFSLAFQYLLYHSTKEKGQFLIRIEDPFLAEKLARKAKDESTRKFLQKIIPNRKFTYGGSSFYLDYFHPQSWNFLQTLPREKWKMAVIVQGTSTKTIQDENAVPEENLQLPGVDLYLTPLTINIPKILWIAYDKPTPEQFSPVNFPFIPDKIPELSEGVVLSEDVRSRLDLDDHEEDL